MELGNQVWKQSLGIAEGINRAISWLGWTDCPGKSLVPLAGLRLGVTSQWLSCTSPQSYNKDLLRCAIKKQRDWGAGWLSR